MPPTLVDICYLKMHYILILTCNLKMETIDINSIFHFNLTFTYSFNVILNFKRLTLLMR